MIYTIDLRPNGLYAFAVTSEVDGLALVFDLRWHDTTGLWVMVVRDVDGEPLGIAQPASPGGQVLLDPSDPRVPAGAFVWQGPDPYTRAALGDTLRLYYSAAE